MACEVVLQSIGWILTRLAAPMHVASDFGTEPQKVKVQGWGIKYAGNSSVK